MSANQISQGVTAGLNTVSVTSVIGVFMGWFPTAVSVVAGLFTIVWMGLQILDNKRFMQFVRWIKAKFH